MVPEQLIGPELRLALRRLAKAVVIVTSKHDGVRHAMAATAVSELSIDPPSMLVCVNKSASMHPVLTTGAPFCINILHVSQEAMARSCSGVLKGEARFETGRWAQARSGIPYLLDAQAAIVCDHATALEFGTHSIFIGRVVEVHLAGEIDPLIYMDGGYCAAQALGKS
ncbi:flavin reductase family protein [Novosphingobium sp. JCM 18896]|uniref:flavin reductase family protein n=1 Tax=Novosphingobium sp. JCM 18896 TaxID=2989731 RepID=UPI002223CC9E|nr:flavin reductase family protein [Novosphingobium sp. JCM 18896]MCW1432292.1 flavin reductase family protein [Novosphingobium sp. JCM 18896]